MPYCHTYKPQHVEQMRETCYRPYSVTPSGVHNTNIIRTSQDYQTRQLNTEDENLYRLIRTSHNLHTHTGNTRQPEPQLKSSSCSSVIPSHNSKDVILSHNSRNATCLTPILSHNSRDTFQATTQETPASRPSRYRQNLVDHTHLKQAKHKPYLCIID